MGWPQMLQDCGVKTTRSLLSRRVPASAAGRAQLGVRMAASGRAAPRPAARGPGAPAVRGVAPRLRTWTCSSAS